MKHVERKKSESRSDSLTVGGQPVLHIAANLVSPRLRNFPCKFFEIFFRFQSDFTL